jgi:hypothetical protein
VFFAAIKLTIAYYTPLRRSFLNVQRQNNTTIMSHTTVVEGQPSGVGLTKPDIEHDDPAHLDWSKLEGVIMARTEIGQLTDSYFRCFDTTSTGNGELALITGPSGGEAANAYDFIS